MAPGERPILLPCHGASARGVEAEGVAEELSGRGLVDLVDDIESIAEAARGGREVIALDGCSTSCQARLLDAIDLHSLRAVNLSDTATSAQVVGALTSVAELEAATSPIRRTRAPISVRSSGSSARRMNSLDDYLLAVDTLTSPVVQCGAVVDAPTLASHVARLLGVTRAAAGEMLARIEDEGYVRRGANKELLLTAHGRQTTDGVLRRHRILECFAFRTLGHELGDSYERAREMAPGFVAEDIERIWQSLERPETCPHGWPIEPERARREGRGLVALASVEQSASLAVERIEEASSDRVGALVAVGIEPGRTLFDVVTNNSAETVTFAVDGSRRSIGSALAASVLVRI